MGLLTLPWQVKAGAAVIGAGFVFGLGFKVESWRGTDALDTEKLAHQTDVAALKLEWGKRVDAEHGAYVKVVADREADRLANEAAREKSEDEYIRDIGRRNALANRNAGDAQRLRDDLKAAIAAGRISNRDCPVRQADPGAICSGPGGADACGFLDRALDLAKRCSETAGGQHAAVVEAVSQWPR